MNKTDFLSELEKLLKDIPEDERKDAMSYYFDYLDGDDDAETEKRIEELGTPEELAEKIKLASGDTHVIEGEFTETGYSDSADDTRDVPDKYTQVAKSDDVVSDNKGEKKYNLFGVTITKSVLIILIILLLLIVPIFGRLCKKIIKTATRVPNIFMDLDDIGDAAGDLADKVVENAVAASGDKATESKNVTVDGNKMVIGEASEVKEIKIDAAAISFYIKEASGSEISAECDDDVKCDATIDSGTLTIKVARKNKNALDKNKKAILYLPKGMKVEDAEFELAAIHMIDEVDFECEDLTVKLGAGDVKMPGVKAEKADIEIGAGELVFDALTVKDADIDVDMGDFTMDGDITGDLDLDVAMGNATLKLKSKDTDHDYDYEVGMGNLDIGKKKISGMAGSDTIDNDSDSDYEISVGMGNVTIKF